MASVGDWSFFEQIAAAGGWQRGRSESLSGTGSSLEATRVLRPRLAEMLGQLSVRSLVDAPCGDMNWMRHLNYPFEKFIGIDIAPTLIGKLKSENFPPQYHFQLGNIATDILPAADAVFCRDCLVHLPYEAIFEIRRLWKIAGFRFMFATTFINRTINTDCLIGGWRPLNMQIAPFDWSQPLAVFLEDYEDASYRDKAIGVWAL